MSVFRPFSEIDDLPWESCGIVPVVGGGNAGFPQKLYTPCLRAHCLSPLAASALIPE